MKNLFRSLVMFCFFFLILLSHITASGTHDYDPAPEEIITADSVNTRIGPLEYFDGMPSEETTELLFDQLDFQRGVRAFLDFIPVASLSAMRDGLEEVGCTDGTVGIYEDLMDSRSLFLTANTESIYAFTWLDLSNGPVVVESAPNTLGIVDNFWFEYVADLGNAGPDRGKGGKFLFIPPGYEGDIPEGYFTYHSSTYGNILLWRGFLVDGSPSPAVASMKNTIKIYPLSKENNPPKQEFVNLSGRAFNTIHANDYHFFEEISTVIQEENLDGLDPELLGILESIGIVKGKPFAPDERMKAILNDSVAVGNATARTLAFMNRDPESSIYGEGAWKNGFIGGSHEFLRDGIRLLDARSLFFYYATMTTPAMVAKMVGAGSQYAAAMTDSEGNHLDGGRTYKLTLPPDVPVQDFWSVVVYDNQTRSMLQTDQQFPSLNSLRTVTVNSDGSTDIYFGPVSPEGKKGNWIQTIPGKGWNVLMRLYGPLEPWFDQTWRLGEIELMKEVLPVTATDKRYKMTTDIPESILTADHVETCIGTLKFFDGFPSKDTVKLIYENLDFMRGVESFLTTMPAASIYAMRQGYKEIGILPNTTVGITESLMDSIPYYLTANTESVYIGAFLDLSVGPIVVESPPNTLGMVNDQFFRYVADLGNAGPDKGQGGKFLFLPPDWEGDIPEEYFTYRSSTYNNLLFWRGFLENGDPAAAVASAKENVKIYPLAWPELREKIKFKDISKTPHNTVHANSFDFFLEVHQVLQDEPAGAFNSEILGLLDGIGIRKGSYFEPDSQMKNTLIEAVAVGNGIARAITFRNRDPQARYYEDSAWFTAFVGGNHEFLTENGAMNIDARTLFHYPATAITPAMTMEVIGVGSQYAIATVDSNNDPLDGAKTYSLTLPADIPAKDFWSFIAYDLQTRSMLQTPGTLFPSVSSQSGEVKENMDGTTTVWFGPEAPEGMESNWIETVQGKGFFTILRLYGPLESWFDKSWKPGELILE